MKTNKKKILVVDDNPIHRGLLANELADLGYEVERARDDEEGDANLTAFKPDLLVTDLVVRGDRNKIIRWVKRLRLETEYENLPILFVTAFGEDMRAEVESITSSDVLLKPFDYEQILEKVRNLLQSKT